MSLRADPNPVCGGRLVLLLLCVSVPLWLPSAFAQTPDELAQQRHAKAAGEAMQRHDYAAAELEYLELVRSMPDVAELRSNLGLSYYLQKKYQPAEEEFQCALKLNPSLYAPNYFLGRMRHSQKRFRDALPFFDRALALQPGNAEVLRQLAATTVGVSFRLFRVPKTLVVCRHFHPVSARAQRNSLARSYSKQPALG
ncbi:MAG: hypothetical protein DMG05_20700 [Acidobacteria bacterium]|nr:MAG: hypothetical protein DMG05_20700 [Acidobacteriota bacterium]